MSTAANGVIPSHTDPGPYAPAGTAPTLLLLDGHSLAFRAFYALPADRFATTTGQPTNAVYGFTSMLIRLLQQEQPTHVAVAFDVSRHTWRTDEFPDYKAQRGETPEEFIGQIGLIQQVLAALAIPSIEADGYEADDILATLATAAGVEKMAVRICTGDRDAFQLVTDDVTVLYPIKGVSEMRRYTPAAVEEKYGLTPAQYPDFAALRGDPSDNLPGIPRVGEKTAAKWIRQFGSLDSLLARADEVTGKVGESLRDNLDVVRRNRRLTEMVREVPLELGPADLRARPFEVERVHEIFDVVQFRTLRERFLAAFAGAASGATGGSGAADGRGGAGADEPGIRGYDVARRVLGSGQVSGWLDRYGAERVGVVCEGTFGGGGGDVSRLVLASVAAGAGDDAEASDEGTADGGTADEGTADGVAAVIDVGELDPDDDAALAGWLADETRPKIFHGAKPQLGALAQRGWQVRGIACDTELAAYLLKPGQRTFDVADLLGRYVDRTLDDPAESRSAADAGADAVAEVQPALIDSVAASGDQDAARDAADGELARRARALVDLADALESALTDEQQLTLLRDMELPVMMALAAMEQAGIAVDVGYIDELQSGFAEEGREAEQGAFAAIGHEVNLGSPKQLQGVLFDELGMPKTKRTKTGYTTDAKALQWLATQPGTDAGHDFLAHLLAHRDVTKLRTTVEGLAKAVGGGVGDDRIHSTFLQTVTTTGRLSSTEPNLQNVPVRTEAGRKIRRAFVAGRGYDGLLTADYSQIEMRIMAHASGDAGLIEAFRSGEDLHTAVAMRAFGVGADEVTAELRRRTKAMSYGLAYGLSAFGLSQQLGISVDAAREQMDAYFARFGGVRDYLDQVVDEARRTEYTQTLMGRRRHLPDLNSTNRQRREMAERAALNAPIQGTAADIIKIAMIRVDRRISREGLRSRMLLQVHDELVCEVAPGEREALTAVLTEEMAGAFELDVPLEVSVGYGPDWDAAAH